MNVADLIIIVLLAVIVVLAVRHSLKRTKNGCCSGGPGCTCGCGGCEKNGRKEEKGKI